MQCQKCCAYRPPHAFSIEIFSLSIHYHIKSRWTLLDRKRKKDKVARVDYKYGLFVQWHTCLWCSFRRPPDGHEATLTLLTSEVRLYSCAKRFLRMWNAIFELQRHLTLYRCIKKELTFGILAQRAARFGKDTLLWLTMAWDGFVLEGFSAGTGSSVDNVLPVSGSARGQFLPAFHEEDAGIANFTRSLFRCAEALVKLWLVLFAVSEARRRWLCSADAATQVRAVDFWFVKAEHCDALLVGGVEWSGKGWCCLLL